MVSTNADCASDGIPYFNCAIKMQPHTDDRSESTQQQKEVGGRDVAACPQPHPQQQQQQQ